MRLKALACGVFEPYVSRLAAECGNEVDIVMLDAGLHASPYDLRIALQQEIDTAAHAGGYDGILLFYGLCGRGVADLIARDAPVVIPRAHDCITLFLGSHETYLQQFARNPGTFYSTQGWIEKSTHPKHQDAAHLYSNYSADGYASHPMFGTLQDQYGGDNARHVLGFFDRWKQHYSRSAYIDLGMAGEDDYAALARRMAEVNGWAYERLPGDASLMLRMLSGDWDTDRLFVLQPGSRVHTTGDDRIMTGAPVDQEVAEDPFPDGDVVLYSEPGIGAGTGIGLGIDAGGTYTDAVVYDLGRQRVLAKSKSLTTYHDLIIGIRGALSGLPADALAQVRVTSLSTTLATNSIVEGRGHRVGLIVLAPWAWFGEAIEHTPMVHVPGCVDVTGEVLEPLDEDACRAAVRRLVDDERCAAIVISGYGTIRNPDQANRTREIAMEMTDLPIICSHEVSRRLNAVQGARTAVANARLLPVIRHLIDSVHQALADFEVPGPLMVVKGDGTPVDESVARARPIETILSGPAASVSGARLLTGLRDALVIDVGGTTTDCAILEDGHVGVAEEGARVGPWVMSIDVVDICTVGLGGDSRIDFTRDRDLTIGPQRNIPFSYLAYAHPSVEAFLSEFEERRHAGSVDASALDVLVAGAPGRLALTDRESALMDLLADGPLPAMEVAVRLGMPTHRLLPTGRLEACGMLQRGALTPTDLLHASGRFERWHTNAAQRALEIFAAMLGRSPADTLNQAMQLVTRRVFEEVLRREASREDRTLHDLPADWRFLLDKAFADDGRGLGVALTLRRPIVAIGAPARELVPPVAAHIHAEVIVPEHADVANAVGAIGTEIVVREEVLIQPGMLSEYVLYGTEERLEFAELQRATEQAVEIARRRVMVRARESGARCPAVTVTRRDSAGSSSDGGRVFLERRVIAVATGGAFAGEG